MARKQTLDQGAAAISRLFRSLDDPDDLSHELAQLVLTQAVRNASGRPTPQAPMVARALQLTGSTIAAPAGGIIGDLASPSEFGSDTWLQFHRGFSNKGSWLYPAVSDPVVLDQANDALEAVVSEAVDG